MKIDKEGNIVAQQFSKKEAEFMIRLFNAETNEEVQALLSLKKSELVSPPK